MIPEHKITSVVIFLTQVTASKHMISDNYTVKTNFPPRFTLKNVAWH